MDEQPVVEAKGISKHFGEGATRVDALREVSLDVYPGTVVGLRGPSGSGKSTLLNVIGCIQEPNSGSMRLNGELVYDGKWLRADLRSLRLEKIGFIFQSHNLLPFLTAWENVAVARILAGASPALAKSRALELLTYLGIERRGDAMPGELWVERRSGSPLPARWLTTRASFWPMSRPLRSIRSVPAQSWTC